MIVLLISAAVIIFDQVTKYLIRSSFALYESVPVIGKFFNLTYVTNDGMAFGINFPGGNYLFTVTSLILTVIIFLYLWRERKNSVLLRVSLAFILAGAIGNLTDRMIHGEVADFLDFNFWGYHWYIFNIADSSVTIGMFLFIIYSFVDSSAKNKAKSND
jgi:signal peptidase II